MGLLACTKPNSWESSDILALCTCVKNGVSDPTKAQNVGDQYGNDIKSDHWRKALKEGFCGRERARMGVSPTR